MSACCVMDHQQTAATRRIRMLSLYTAIIHLREPADMRLGARIEPMLRLMPGVDEINYEPAESLVTVVFDRGQTGLAELVRFIEDQGASVSGVAQRPLGLRMAG